MSAASCGTPRPPSPAPADPFAAGTYTTDLTGPKQDALRLGMEDECALQSDGLHLRLIVGGGRCTPSSASASAIPTTNIDRDLYTATDTTISMSPNQPGKFTVYAWHLVNGVLTLEVVDETQSPPGDIPYNHFLYEHAWEAAAD